MASEVDRAVGVPARSVGVAGALVNTSSRTCGCRCWSLLERLDRDVELDRVMDWAWQAHWVRLKLLAHGDHVGVHELRAGYPGRGEARRVMVKLCRWADRGAVTLELTGTGEFGADLDRLTKFYVSLGFTPNSEPTTPFRWRGEMIRHPIPGRRHGSP